MNLWPSLNRTDYWTILQQANQGQLIFVFLLFFQLAKVDYFLCLYFFFSIQLKSFFFMSIQFFCCNNVPFQYFKLHFSWVYCTLFVSFCCYSLQGRHKKYVYWTLSIMTGEVWGSLSRKKKIRFALLFPPKKYLFNYEHD